MPAPSKLKLVPRDERGFPPITGRVEKPAAIAIIRLMAATVITRLIAEVESSTEPDGYQFEVFIPISEDEVGRIKRANEGDELRASMDRAIKKTLPTTLQRSFRYSHATYRTAEKGYGFLFLIQA